MSEKQTAVVTGGSRGIGRAIAVELARHGYDVVITYKANDEAAAETLQLIRDAGRNGRRSNSTWETPLSAEGISTNSSPVWSGSMCWSTTPE